MLPRHNLVWPTARGWDAMQAAGATQAPSVRDAIARWRAADWPLVVRRAEPDQAAAKLALGLPLPPDAQGIKVRIGGLIDADAVRRTDAPLVLEAVLPAVPPPWRAAVAALQLDWPEEFAPLRTYGSLAWQAITGMPYLRRESDIDLLFQPASRRELDTGTALLARHGVALPLDGEIIFPGGAAVAWREWRAAMVSGGAGTVLAKGRDRVQLISCQALLLLFALPLRRTDAEPHGSVQPPDAPGAAAWRA